MLISDPILEKLFITASLSSGDILPCINPTLPGNSADNCSYLHWEMKASKKERKKERKGDSDRVSESKEEKEKEREKN